jgi:hypothetical protein
MSVDETSLFEEFVRARQEAVELTDWYRQASGDAPNHDQLWEQVVRQTEEARSLLETWLEQQSSPARPHTQPMREPSLSQALTSRT